MSNKNEALVLHSHSGLERELKMDKRHVLIDERYKDMFADGGVKIERFMCHGTVYYKVPVLAFVMRGGYFKNYIG